ncbi:MAG: hypothetical protein P4L56_06705 [Candidatus Sulfopaludibacter sp.]|nr:hypothetical protein [Candidatus Sulfopaludibacter sp.]
MLPLKAQHLRYAQRAVQCHFANAPHVKRQGLQEPAGFFRCDLVMLTCRFLLADRDVRYGVLILPQPPIFSFRKNARHEVAEVCARVPGQARFDYRLPCHLQHPRFALVRKPAVNLQWSNITEHRIPPCWPNVVFDVCLILGTGGCCYLFGIPDELFDVVVEQITKPQLGLQHNLTTINAVHYRPLLLDCIPLRNFRNATEINPLLYFDGLPVFVECIDEWANKVLGVLSAGGENLGILGTH